MKVAFIGLNNFENKPLLAKVVRNRLEDILEKLITQNRAKEFVFGKIGYFSHVSYLAVNKLKRKYPRIKRVYISKFVDVDRKARKSLAGFFEKVKYPMTEFYEEIKGNNIRNELIIDDFCDLLIIYYDSEFDEIDTQHAYNYAMAKGKKIINLFDENDAKNIVF